MLRKLILSFLFLGALMTGNAHALVDSGPAINGTPSQFAIYALEDIFTYQNSSYEIHIEHMKNGYFSEDGWKEFQKAITKNGFIKALTKRDSLGVYEYWVDGNQKKQESEDHNERKKKFSAEFVGPIQIILMRPEGSPSHPMNVKEKMVLRVNVKLKISASKDPVKKYGSHFADDVPAYNYKIESFEFVPRR